MKNVIFLTMALAFCAIRASAVGVDDHLRPGFRFSCEVTFLSAPTGQVSLITKRGEYWLRYDVQADGRGAFCFFVCLNGGWEPRASVSMAVMPGCAYRIAGGWNGRASVLDVNGTRCEPILRRGRCAMTASPLVLGEQGRADVSKFILKNEPKALLSFGMFRTRELLPRLGAPTTLEGVLFNDGKPLGACRLTAIGRDGVAVTPSSVEIPPLAEGATHSLAWTVDPGTNGLAFVDFVIRPVDEPFVSTDVSRPLVRATKRIVFLPEADPDLSAHAWQPPVRPTRTWHVDSAAGNDAHDGLTPQTAWRTFRNAAGLVLGPGERLLLKRGCVFREELTFRAKGSPDNWAEVGAYGEGMRPQIRRSRHPHERCLTVPDASYLAIRDLIVCNAGAGLAVTCASPDSGNILVERCLAHHIEGNYRLRAHGIPEWNADDPPAGMRSVGFSVADGTPRSIVLRDCEAYQCSGGFSVRGTETFVNRMYCHDAYAPNTSPHPCNRASRSWMTDCVFEAAGWQASAGTMGIMLAGNDGFVVRGCHFLDQPDSGSPDQGGIDFEASGENCLVERCTFRNNAGAAIEILGLHRPQTRNLWIRHCRFDRNNWAFKNGPAEIQVWGLPNTSPDIACAGGRIEDNGYVLLPGVAFYTNETCAAQGWTLTGNRTFDFSEDLDAAFPLGDPPSVTACGEVWTDAREVALWAKVDDPNAAVAWETIEGPSDAAFADPSISRTRATFPFEGDYRVNVKADNGILWRTARTAVHVLPPGARTVRAWDFSRNLDTQGWTAVETGTAYVHFVGKSSFWDAESYPVKTACGDYFVVAVRESGRAAIVTSDTRGLGVTFRSDQANAIRIRMQNGTSSRRLRIWWQTRREPTWDLVRSVSFEVTPHDSEDTVYTVPMPMAGEVKQLKISFSSDGEPVTGTARIDYIWVGRLP